MNSEVDKLDIDKLYELDADKSKTVYTDLRKLSDVVKIDVVITLRSKLLKIKCLVLLTYILIMLLMLK